MKVWLSFVLFVSWFIWDCVSLILTFFFLRCCCLWCFVCSYFLFLFFFFNLFSCLWSKSAFNVPAWEVLRCSRFFYILFQFRNYTYQFGCVCFSFFVHLPSHSIACDLHTAMCFNCMRQKEKACTRPVKLDTYPKQ